jgi:hypothetical protein
MGLHATHRDAVGANLVFARPGSRNEPVEREHGVRLYTTSAFLCGVVKKEEGSSDPLGGEGAPARVAELPSNLGYEEGTGS